jgi:hypothetical protein
VGVLVNNWPNILVQCYHIHSVRMLLTSDRMRLRPDYAMSGDVFESLKKLIKGIQSKRHATLLFLKGDC